MLSSLAAAATAAGTGAAEIDESLITQTLYVDPVAGNNNNAGTEAEPLQTIRKALDIFAAGSAGTKIVLQAGTYREGNPGASHMLGYLPTPSATKPLIIEGAGWSPGNHTGDVIISGSEDWSGGWTDTGETINGRTVYSKSWAYQWGQSNNPYGGANTFYPTTVKSHHLVHVDGQTYYEVIDPDILAQVNASTPNTPSGYDPINNVHADEGFFFVNETEGNVYIAPPVGTSLASALVEVSTKRLLLHHWRPQSQTSATPFALRNLVFQHAAPGIGKPAVVLQNMVGLVIEDCRFLGNKNFGLQVEGINAVYTIRRSHVSGNGTTGAGFSGIDILIEDTLFAQNSRQADVSQYYGWGYGGFKLGGSNTNASKNATFREVEARNNYGVGMWVDTAVYNVLIEDSVSEGNTTCGLFVENCNSTVIAGLGTQTTVHVRNSILSGNRQTSPQGSVQQARGLYLSESENVIVEDSIIYGNQIQVRVTDGLSRGPLGNTTLKNNIIAAAENTDLLYQATSVGIWEDYMNGLNAAADGNQYYHPGSTVAFLDDSAQLNNDLAGWQGEFTGGQEANSTWAEYPVESTVEVELVPKTSPLQVGYDLTASGGQYISVPNGTGNQSSAPIANGFVSFIFVAGRTADYRLWIRCRSESAEWWKDDSAWVSLNDGPLQLWAPSSVGTTWNWVAVAMDGDTTPTLEAGWHNISLAYREDGFQIDAVVLTEDLNYNPDSDYVLPTVDSERVYFEAEHGSVASPLAAEVSEEASAYQYLVVPDIDRPSNQNPATTEGYTDCSFELFEAGDYEIYVRAITPDGKADSCHVVLNGDFNNAITWHMAQKTDWTWMKVPGGTRSLAAGQHTVRFVWREDGVKFDRICVSKNGPPSL